MGSTAAPSSPRPTTASRILPTSLCYGIGHVGTWIAWRLMPGSNAALADNLRAVFPDESEDRLRRRALDVYRSYTRDAIDFLKARVCRRRPSAADVRDRAGAAGERSRRSTPRDAASSWSPATTGIGKPARS